MTTEHASFAGQLAWDLGNGFNFSYLLGAYFDIHSQFAWSSPRSISGLPSPTIGTAGT